MLEEVNLPEAVEMARRGATPGMIRQRLRANGLDDKAAQRVVHRARRLASWQDGVAPSWRFIVGGCLVLSGCVGISIGGAGPTIPFLPVGMILLGGCLIARAISMGR